MVIFFMSFIRSFVLFSCSSLMCDLWLWWGDCVFEGLFGDRNVVCLLIIFIKGFKIFWFLNFEVEIFFIGVEDFDGGGVLLGVGVWSECDWS